MSQEKEEISTTTDAINKSGFFLQSHVINELKNANWESEVEFPIQVAPFVSDPKQMVRKNLLVQTEIFFHHLK